MKKAAAVLGAVVVAAAIGALAASPPPRLPRPAEVRSAWCPSDLRVLDRRGVVLREVRVDATTRRLAWTSLSEISPALVGAVLASEDRRFHQHGGVDARAVAAALWQRLRGGPARGASTISMQVAALVEPGLARGNGPRSFLQKSEQMRAAWALEGAWTKAQILEAYLNLVTFRGEVVGTRAAADAIFGKHPHGLSAAESAVLAASLRAPNAGDEDLRRRARRLAHDTREVAAGNQATAGAGSSTIADAGHETIAVAIDAAVERAGRVPEARGPRAVSAWHATRLLTAGAEPCRDVASTLDAGIQAVAEDSLRRHLLELRDRSARDGAVLVVDNDSGEALAYVGSSGDLSPTRFVDGVHAPRQAGSTLKPFLYASAIERGLLTPASLLEDLPLEVPIAGGAYRPTNYDDSYRSLVSVRTALASSLNIPAVRALLLVGDDDFAATLRRAGLSGVNHRGDYYGPSLALGSADVSLWDLVGAYRALAGGGLWKPLRWKTGAGNDDSRRVFGPATAWLVGDMLSDRQGRSATFGLENALATPFWSAVKTGTSKDMRDNWCIGWSRRFTVGVWVGNFSGESMHDVSGVDGAAPVWEAVMASLHAELPSRPPPPPDGVVSAWTTFASGAEAPRQERYRRGSEPLVAGRALEAAARIASPVHGSILALDPDIAPARQRVALQARAARDGLAWQLDGRALGSAASPLLWEPQRGRHELALVDESGRRIDTVKFEVRGAATAGAGS